MIGAERYQRARARMVDQQLRHRDITDPRVLEAMAAVPRHCFVLPDRENLAYADGPLPIGEGQTISQPYIVALMTQLLELKGEEEVLEIGTGSGYQAAVLACLAKQVYTVERIQELARRAYHILETLEIENVEVFERDGSQGLPERAPFDGILVAAGAPKAPEPLKQQLADGGRLVIPVGGRGGQILERWRRQGDEFHTERIAPVAFVPLLGEEGWAAEEDRPSIFR